MMAVAMQLRRFAVNFSSPKEADRPCFQGFHEHESS